MSKIDATLKDLIRSLRRHAKIVGARQVSLKKSERALIKVHAAATAYATEVQKKIGVESPILAFTSPGLDVATVMSLEAEPAALAEHRSGQLV